LLSLKHVVKYAQDRCLIKIEGLRIFEGEKIGIIGRNGVGKSTLLGILAGTVRPDEGDVKRYCSCSYIEQLDAGIQPEQEINRLVMKRFAANREYNEAMSGGEKARYRLAAALSKESPLLLADEPTANLDVSGIVLFQEKLENYQGSFVLVSHDRQLLDAVCNVIWEINEGRLQVYHGNYSDYLTQKEDEKKRQEREYKKYVHEKKHLEQAVIDRKSRSISTRKAPKRMGNSEARLHKMGDQKAKASLDKSVKAMESRLAKLEVKEKPKVAPAIHFGLNQADGLHSKVVIRGEGIHKSFGKQVLFKNADFTIMKGQKVALFGNNGCGKTTLFEMIVGGERQIYVSPAARLGYFVQGMDNLNPAQSILGNVMAVSVKEEGFVRQLLAQLLFRREDVYKRVGVLSGGERVRVCLARIIANEANVLLLDEPTNYLDLPSMEALETVLTEYQGTILFASHDRKFINKLATHLMIFTQKGIQVFGGNLEQYFQDNQVENDRRRKLSREERLLVEYRLAEVISRLSVAKDKDDLARLDEEYRALLTKMQ